MYVYLHKFTRTHKHTMGPDTVTKINEEIVSNIYIIYKMFKI